MSKAIVPVFVLTLTFLFGGTTRAEDVSYVTKSCCDACGADKCDGGCGGCSGWVAEFEAMFLRYNRGDGVRVGGTAGQDVNFDNEFAPRFSVGWMTASDMGFRARYFEFDHAALAINAVDSISVDAMNLDLELFERIDISSCTSLEWSAGVRYNDFREELTVTNTTQIVSDFEGWGLILGLEVNRQIGWGSVFARGHGALLVGDSAVTDDADGLLVLNDATQGMLDIALGWEACRELNNGMLATVGVAYEMQNWFNYSTAFDTGVIIGDADGREDVGFDGFLINFAIER